MPIVKYNGIDWVSFFTDLFVVLVLSLVLAIPAQMLLQWIISIWWVDVVHYWQALIGTFVLIWCVWYGAFKSYGKWEKHLKF